MKNPVVLHDSAGYYGNQEVFDLIQQMPCVKDMVNTDIKPNPVSIFGNIGIVLAIEKTAEISQKLLDVIEKSVDVAFVSKGMFMEMETTQRGYLRVNFKDLDGCECSIQESSQGSAIWIGCNTGTHHLGECLARMRLNQKQAAELIPVMQYFVENGCLPEPAA